MYHVDNSTGVPVMPQPSPVTSETELFFTEGGNGVPPTFPGSDWFNIIQSELINILRAAGLDPDKMDNTQILAALKKLFLSRSNPFGDIKADGAAAIATALSNLHLIGGLASDVVGRLIGVRVYTASTAYVETEGTKTGLAIITGGGGGGGYCLASSTANTFSGAGGGAAGTCIGLFNLSDITNKAITIGAGGIDQTDGGNTTFAGMVAGGGKKGGWMSSTSTPGGLGGTATGGILNIAGGMGNDGQAGAYLINGSGGGSLWGSGGRSGHGGGIGAPAYGAGGGGAYDTEFTNTTYQGGNGAPGVALILEFA